METLIRITVGISAAIVTALICKLLECSEFTIGFLSGSIGQIGQYMTGEYLKEKNN